MLVMTDRRDRTYCSRIVVVVPYFGRLPTMFPLWLISCGYNSEIDWLVFTDDISSYECPGNVKIIHMSFDTIRATIQHLYTFKILLSTSYELCQFRPAYGHIFKEYLINYDFWGYCDLDVVFGRISNFISQKILEKYDKILWLGHFSLYRNTPKINSAYMLKTLNGDQLYEKAFTTTTVPCFDERGINDIFEANGLKLYRTTNFADFVHRNYLFKLLYYKNNDSYNTQNHIFSWKDGVLTRHYILNGVVLTEEFLYIHFCKRPMKLDFDLSKHITSLCIIPNKFVFLPNVINVDYIIENTQMRVYWEYWMPRIKPKHILKRIKGLITKLFR